MQKPSTDTRDDVVFDDEQVGRAREDLELLGVVEILHVRRIRGLERRRDPISGSVAERLERADGEAVRREPPGHVVEERPQPADVGMQHDAGLGHAVGPGVHDRHVVPVDGQRPLFDGDVELRTFLQVSHERGSRTAQRRRLTSSGRGWSSRRLARGRL